MPDKEIMIQIRALEEQRAWSALDALENQGENILGGLRDALANLAENCRATADLYGRAKLKGAKTAHIDPLRTTAQQLDIVVKQLEQPRRAPLGQVQPVSAPPAVPIDPGLDELPHRFMPGNGEDAGRCARFIERDGGMSFCQRFSSHPAHRIVDIPDARPSLDALIAEASTAREVELRYITADVEREIIEGPALTDDTGRAAYLADPARKAGDALVMGLSGDFEAMDDVAAYLRGETNDLPPGEPPRALVGAHDMSATIEGFWDADHPSCAPETCGGSRLDPCSTILKTDGRRHDGEPDMTIDPVVGHDFTGGEFTAAALAVKADPDGWLGPLPADAPATTAKEILNTVTPDSPGHIPPVPMLGQPGDMGRGYDHGYIPTGGVPYTFAELMTPVPVTILPAHLSHSQADTLADCPAKYRMRRIGRPHAGPDGAGLAEPVTEIPQWANIGGSAFHAAVEAVEREEIVTPGGFAGNRWDAEALWRAHFDAECLKVEASSPVPRGRWRAASKGVEGETWWNVNGPEMLKRYLAARPDQPTLQGRSVVGGTAAMSAGVTPFVAIEWEIKAQVPTPYGPLPYKAILDRVTWDERRGACVIRDYKTGRMPEDSQQLGEYANALRLAGLVFPDAKIYGTFFNARKGEWTPEVDLDEAWPLDWFVYLVTSGHAQKMALTTGPTPARPSSFCGGCAVRWACPIKGTKVKR